MRLLETAQTALDAGPVCDGCLGRCFADLGTGLTNGERGQALRVSATMVQDIPFDPVEPEACWVCVGASEGAGKWADRARDTLEDVSFETFLVGAHVPSAFESHEADLRERIGLDAEAGEPFKAELKRAVGMELERTTGAVVDHDYPDVVVKLDLERDTVDLQLNPAYLFGRYRKHEHGLGQRMRVCRVCNARGTQWREGEAQPCEACGGSGYDTKESVEWYVSEPIREALEGRDTVFNAAGREDDDVLMLGPGRPFVVEVKEPHRRPPDTEAIQSAVEQASDGTVEVVDLSRAHRDAVQHLAEVPVRQTYRLTLSFDAPVGADEFAEATSALEDASVRQQVERGERPVDVIRTVDGISGELTDDQEAGVEIETANGLNLELLMTGGDGASEPSLAGLLETSVTVDETAVVNVEADDGALVDPDHLLGQ